MYKGKVNGRRLNLFELRKEDDVLSCCKQLTFHAKEKEKIIVYEPATRSVGIRISDDVFQLIRHCPWCATRLPKELSEELSRIVFDELKLDGYDDYRLPEEFKSDAWWKKRGL